MISEHASPLAAAGGVDSGGQNIYVAHTARHLAELGYAVDVFTRRDSDKLPDIVEWSPSIRVIHVTAGPPRFVRKESLLPLMSEFARQVVEAAREANERGEPYALCHAHFFMSGLVARRLKQELGIPFVVTFHALDACDSFTSPTTNFRPNAAFSSRWSSTRPTRSSPSVRKTKQICDDCIAPRRRGCA